MTGFAEHNLATGRRVVASPERARRPRLGRDGPSQVDACPFCPGNEAQLPEIVLQRRARAAPGWATRVVPNRYPILRREDPAMPGCHEVVIETPRHADGLTAAEHVDAALTWRDRYRTLAGEWDYVLIFRNRGDRAGQSQAHPHSQIAALAHPPPAAVARERVLVDHHRRTGKAMIDDLAACALADGDAVIARHDGFVALIPAAAETRFETWILPCGGGRDFGDIADADAAAFGRVAAEVSGRLDRAIGGVSYNLIIVTAPRASRRAGHWRWFACIRPRTAAFGGFEHGTGLAVAASSAAEDAAILRDAGSARGD